MRTQRGNPGCRYPRCYVGLQMQMGSVRLRVPICSAGCRVRSPDRPELVMAPTLPGQREVTPLASPEVPARRRWRGTTRLCPGIWLWKPLAEMIFPGGNEQPVGAPDPHRTALYLFKKKTLMKQQTRRKKPAAGLVSSLPARHRGGVAGLSRGTRPAASSWAASPA